jgi:hypothetical protein
MRMLLDRSCNFVSTWWIYVGIFWGSDAFTCFVLPPSPNVYRLLVHFFIKNDKHLGTEGVSYIYLNHVWCICCRFSEFVLYSGIACCEWYSLDGWTIKHPNRISSLDGILSNTKRLAKSFCKAKYGYFVRKLLFINRVSILLAIFPRIPI